jgi:membrane fusion protein, multidrug efflux system
MRQSLLVASLLLTSVLGGLSYLFFVPTSSSPPPLSARTATSVRVAEVQLARLTSQLPLVGKLQALQSIVITPEVSGRITALPQASGGEVAAGARLIQLDDARQQAVFAEAEAFLGNEQRKLRDMRRLVSKGVVTQNDFDGQVSVVAQAEARRDMAAFELSQRRLLAPFAGQVSLYDISLGALVNSGETLLHLDDLASMRLDLAVPERYFSHLQPGTPVQAQTTAWPDRRFAGVIEAIDSRVDSDSLNIKVRMKFANPQRLLRPGMLMQVTLPFASEQLPLIPMQAVEFQGNERFVYLLTPDSRVTRQSVTLGGAEDSRVSVLSGIKAGDRLVVEGLVALKPGQRVRVITEPESVSAATATLPAEPQP